MGKRKPKIKAAVFADARILFCTPLTLDTVYKSWFCTFQTVTKPPNTITSFDSTMPLSTNRNKCVQRAIDGGWDYLCFIDHDNILPPDAVARLWQYNLPVVGGLYFERSYPHLPLLYTFNPVTQDITVALDYPKGLVKCDVLGMGCSLWKTEVFKQFPSPWFAYRRVGEGEAYGTEDIAIFQKLKALGIPVHVDTNLTIGHTGMYTFTEEDWLRCKPGYVRACMEELAKKGKVAGQAAPPVITSGDASEGKKRVLHVGCGNTEIPPDLFPATHWQETRLDVDPQVRVDVVSDILKMPVEDGTYDAVFSAHTLEHFDRRDRDLFMAECLRVIKTGGMSISIVPDACHPDIVKAMAAGELDKVLYVAPAGPIQVQDVLWGGFYSGPYYRHYWGYSKSTLLTFLSKTLSNVWVNTCRGNELIGIGYKKPAVDKVAP
jgi:SAM-dependent methyltransferase